MVWDFERMWELDTRFIDVIQGTPSVKTFRLDTRGHNADYQAGQFFFITIIVNVKDANHHFTISSSPTETGYIKFTKRIPLMNFLKPWIY